MYSGNPRNKRILWRYHRLKVIEILKSYGWFDAEKLYVFLHFRDYQRFKIEVIFLENT